MVNSVANIDDYCHTLVQNNLDNIGTPLRSVQGHDHFLVLHVVHAEKGSDEQPQVGHTHAVDKTWQQTVVEN